MGKNDKNLPSLVVRGLYEIPSPLSLVHSLCYIDHISSWLQGKLFPNPCRKKKKKSHLSTLYAYSSIHWKCSILNTALYIPVWHIVVICRAVLIVECLFHTVVQYFERDPGLEKTHGLGETSAYVSVGAIRVEDGIWCWLCNDSGCMTSQFQVSSEN